MANPRFEIPRCGSRAGTRNRRRFPCFAAALGRAPRVSAPAFKAHFMVYVKYTLDK
jgi:hypothetical protein